MKLDILMHYEINEQTGEVKFIGKEEITVDTAEKAVKKTATKAVSTVISSLPINLTSPVCSLIS